MKTLLTALVAAYLGAANLNAGIAAASSDYAVVVSQKTAGIDAWSSVTQSLAAKHQGVIITFTNSVDEALPALQRQFPRYVCFVARPEEATREFVAQVHRLTRRFNDDPYTDCFWGILTGHDATNALRIVKQSAPLIVRRVGASTPIALDMVEEGVWYSELEKNKMVKKEKGGVAKDLHGPDDTTHALVNLLNDYHADLFITSGHASEHDWSIGYRYRNGFFRHDGGQLYGADAAGQKFNVDSPNPKIYMPVGNCLMGHVTGPDCMATAWMNSAGVCQMFGYTVETWYGYGGWGVLDYFVEQPGRYTFTEAFFANQLALEHRLATYFPELLQVKFDPAANTAIEPVLGTAAKAAGLTVQDGRGLVYDLDTVAFYGDPAWQVRMADEPKFFEQKLTGGKNTFTFEITPNRGADSFQPVNTNGSQRGGRPFIAFLPHRVGGVKIIEGAELNPVITDNFILVPNPGTCDPAKKYRVVFAIRGNAR